MNTPDNRWSRRGLTVAMPLIAGLLLRLWFVQHAARVDGDALIYGDIAQNWLRHGVYGFSRTMNTLPVPPRPTLIRLPGYPLFMMACFKLFGVGNYSAVVLVQVLVDLATCCLLADLCRRVFGRRAGLAALWMAALCPFTANYTAAPLTETLSLACIAVAFYSLLRWQSAGARRSGWLLGIGAALAYAVLLRPEQGMLAAAVVPAVLCIGWTVSGNWLGAVRPALIVSLLTVLPLVPWTIRNERTFHLFQPLAPRFATDPGEAVPYGFQRWFRTWGVDFASTQEAYWNYDGAAIDLGDLPDRAFDSKEQFDTTDELLDSYNDVIKATPAFDRRFNAIALQRIHDHPVRYYVLLPVARLTNMILRPRTEMMAMPLRWWEFGNWPTQTLFAGTWAAINLVYMALGVLGFLRWRRLGGYRVLAWSMAATILMRCALLLTLDNSEPRYTLEFFPVVIVFAAALWAGRGYLAQELPVIS